MLPRVTRQNHAGIVLAGQTQEFEHLPAANLSGLVHDNQRAGNHFALEQKICDRGWRRKPGLFHVHDLLALRRENDHAPSGQLNRLNEITENKTFTCAGAATEN